MVTVYHLFYWYWCSLLFLKLYLGRKLLALAREIKLQTSFCHIKNENPGERFSPLLLSICDVCDVFQGVFVLPQIASLPFITVTDFLSFPQCGRTLWDMLHPACVGGGSVIDCDNISSNWIKSKRSWLKVQHTGFCVSLYSGPLVEKLYLLYFV